MPPNFWTTTNSRFYTERLGLPRPGRGLPIAIFVFRRDQSILAAQSGDDFVMPAIEFVRFGALTVERGNRFFVFAR